MNHVVYASKSGNTKKVAEAIARGAGTTATDVAAAGAIGKADVLFVGSGVNGGKIDGKLRAWLNGLNAGNAKKVVVFSTSAFKKGVLAEVKSVLDSKGIAVADEEYHAHGKFLFTRIGHPDEAELKEAEAFARRFRK